MKPISIHSGSRLIGLVAISLLLAACAIAPTVAQQTGQWCYQQAKGKLCTSHPVPDLSADAEAKALHPNADRHKLYVYRSDFLDAAGVATVSISGRELQLLPRSFVLAELTPGQHTVSVRSRSGDTNLTIDTKANAFSFVEVRQEWHPLHIVFSGGVVTKDAAAPSLAKARLISSIRDGKD